MEIHTSGFTQTTAEGFFGRLDAHVETSSLIARSIESHLPDHNRESSSDRELERAGVYRYVFHMASTGRDEAERRYGDRGVGATPL
jgi:hypothetical protein